MASGSRLNPIRLNRYRANRRSGIGLTFFAVMLMILMAFVALGVDAGMFFTQQAELQVAATSAAAGAAIDLPDGASATALRLATANMPVDQHGAVLAGSDVVTGHWNSSSRTFAANGTPLNSVRISTRKSAANGNPVRWLVGQALGRQAIEISASATAALLPELPGGISATGSIDMSGNASIDSYDASQGPYDPATAGQEGDIVADGTISLGGSSTVKGDVKGASVSAGGNATVTGSMGSTRRPVDLPSVDTSVVETDNDNASLPLYEQGNSTGSPLDADRNFSLSGGVDYEIPPGNYYFNDFSLSGQSSITISGPTNIYLTGDLDTSGGDVLNSSQNPSDLRILMTGGSAVINASIDTYLLLYAPDSDVTVSGSGEVFGAIVGNNVEFSGTGDVHFDVSLSVGDVIPGLSRRSALVD